MEFWMVLTVFFLTNKYKDNVKPGMVSDICKPNNSEAEAGLWQGRG